MEIDNSKWITDKERRFSFPIFSLSVFATLFETYFMVNFRGIENYASTFLLRKKSYPNWLENWSLKGHPVILRHSVYYHGMLQHVAITQTRECKTTMQRVYIKRS